MESANKVGSLDETVIGEILEVRQRGYRCQDAREAIATSVRGKAAAVAVSALVVGLARAWMRRAELRRVAPSLFALSGVGVCSLLIASVAHRLLPGIGVRMPAKCSDLLTHYRTAHPAESTEASRREIESTDEEELRRREERTIALARAIRRRQERRGKR